MSDPPVRAGGSTYSGVCSKRIPMEAISCIIVVVVVVVVVIKGDSRSGSDRGRDDDDDDSFVLGVVSRTIVRILVMNDGMWE